MTFPISLYFSPGFTMAIALHKHSYVTSTNFFTSGFTLPTRKVSFRSPWKPLWYTVTSTKYKRKLDHDASWSVMTFSNKYHTITNVTVLQWSSIRYAMANHFIDWSATAGGELIIVQRRWITVSLNASFMHYSIDFSCCNTNIACLCSFVQYFSTKLSKLIWV